MTHQEQLNNLIQGFSKYSREELERHHALELLDWAETDTYIRKKCRGIIKDEDIDGDTYGVPTIEDLVDKLIEKIINYKLKTINYKQ